MPNFTQLLTFFFVIISGCLKATLTTSVIVPCHPKHAQYLCGLLHEYEKQTEHPQEVVISLSEAHLVNPEIIRAIQEGTWKFPVKLLLSNKKMFAGQNRNKACDQTVGEIIICQDADDIPHPQRIEVIKYFFTKFNLNFFLHQFSYGTGAGAVVHTMIEDFSALDPIYIHTYHEAWIVGYMLFGQPAFRRNILKTIRWPDIPIDEDNVFANKIITTFPRCAMAKVDLYTYRISLSATPYELYRNRIIKDGCLAMKYAKYGLPA